MPQTGKLCQNWRRTRCHKIVIVIIIIIIQFFIYLRAELISPGPITESARNKKTNNNTTTKQNTHKEDKTKNTNKHKKNKDKAKNANANRIMVPLKEIRAVYMLSSAAAGQLQSQYGA
jgi:uncharacterized membrane protein